MIVGFCVLVVCSAVGIAFAPEIIAIFRREDPQVIEIGALSLRLQCIAYPFTAFVVVSNMMLQTIGKPLKASVTAAARSGIFFIPAILILPPGPGPARRADEPGRGRRLLADPDHPADLLRPCGDEAAGEGGRAPFWGPLRDARLQIPRRRAIMKGKEARRGGDAA